MEATVAVVGAGPAGCAAALTLRRYLPEMPVVLVSAPAGGGPAAGETLSPGVLPLLDYLGLRKEFLDAGHLPAGGTASAWGSSRVAERSYLFTGRGTGWHLDRARFDVWLLAQAQAAGACVVHGRALLQGAIRSESGWLLEIEGVGTIAARAVVDATGRSAQLARRKGQRPRRDDALVADIRWFVDDVPRPAAEGALVESVPDGWWYTASLPGGRAVAMFMTDADLLRQSSWDARLEDAPATMRRVERWRPAGETAVRAANSQITPVVAGGGWVAAGDAAAAFDPVSALGIGFSLRSGMEAARVAAAAAEGDDEGPAAAYTASVARIYADYRSRHRAIYLQERRWPEAPFWARRAGIAPPLHRAAQATP
ncbi:MAG TPA: tryptophan 7-halogenase [Longimicrobium sp.]|nr:tryptophan 7-halogenase [Longimicrobium sp.]